MQLVPNYLAHGNVCADEPVLPAPAHFGDLVAEILTIANDPISSVDAETQSLCFSRKRRPLLEGNGALSETVRRDQLHRCGVAARATMANVLYYETVTRLLNL